MRHGPEACVHSAAETASSLVASRLALASALGSAGFSSLEEALEALDEAELLWLEEPEAAELL